MFRLLTLLGALQALAAVALGAFGAHGLANGVSPALLETWRTAVQYHFGHALGLLLLALLLHAHPQSGGMRWAAWLLLAGIVLFSGSLYLLVLSGQRWLGAVTPLGGLAFLAGWSALAWSTRSLRA